MHRREHEDWCADLASGVTEAVPRALLREMESCAECARTVADLRRVQSGLTRIAEEDGELVAAALKLPSAPGEAQIEQRLRALAPPPAPAHSGAAPSRGFDRRRMLALAAGVALLVGGLWIFNASRSTEPKPPQVLGGGDAFTHMHPSDAGDPLSPFSWRAALPEDGSFTVHLRGLDDAGWELVKRHVRKSEWTPTASELASFPKRFAWSVQVFDSSDSPGPLSPTVVFPPQD